MKKVFFISVCTIVFVFGSVACNKNNLNDISGLNSQSTADSESETTSSPTITEQKMLVNYDRNAKAEYTHTTKTFTKGKVHCEYPEFQGMENKETQKKINEKIKNNQVMPGREIEDYEYYEMKYEITLCTPDILSIVFYGHMQGKKSQRIQSTAHAFVIDLNTLKQLRLQDFFSVDREFERKILLSKSAYLPSSKFTNKKNDNTKETLEEALNYFHFYYDDAPDEIVAYCSGGYNFYVTEDSIWVIFSTAKEVGNHLVIELPA